MIASPNIPFQKIPFYQTYKFKILITGLITGLLIGIFSTLYFHRPETRYTKVYIKVKELEAEKKAQKIIAKNEKFLWVFKKGELLWGISGLLIGKVI